MSDDLEDGGTEDLEETGSITSDQGEPGKKALAVVLVFIIVVSSLGTWFIFFRHWTIREIGDRMIETNGADSFDPFLAGTSVVVEGKVTHIHYTNTTFGPLTTIDLDDYGWLPIVEWAEPSVELGDRYVRKIHFEWSHYNDDKLVLSPQLLNPALLDALQHELATLCHGGICLLGRDDAFSSATILEVFLPKEQGFPLQMFNATIWKGIHSGHEEWHDSYYDNPEIDHMDSLVDGIGESGRLVFVDADSNSMLNDGDYFKINLTRPDVDSAVQSYLLEVNHVPGWNDPHTGVLAGSTYISMTNRGLLRWTFSGDSLTLPFPGGRLEVVSEVEHIDGMASEIILTDLWGPSQSLASTSCSIRDEDMHTFGECEDGLEDGVVLSIGNLSISYQDADGDGYLGIGDTFSLLGLVNLTEYLFIVGEIGGSSRFISIRWLVGIGEPTGYLPVVDWEAPSPMDPPANLTYRLRIQRMYGIPGIDLQDTSRQLTFNLKAAETLLFSSVNVTPNQSLEMAPITVCFYDDDDNGYINTGDYFVVESSIVVKIEFTLNYVARSWDETEYETSVLWPVVWRTG